MAQFPVSKPFPRNASAGDFVQRIREVGWAPCNAEQLFGYAFVQFARILPTGTAKSAIALRRAKAQAVDEWFAAMGLPDSLITEEDFTDYADGDRWVSGVGLDSTENDEFGIIAIGAFEVRSDGSFALTTVSRYALVERWDSRVAGPVAERLLLDTSPLEVVVAVFTDDESLLVAGFHPRVFRLNARTLGDARELVAFRHPASCPHGPPESSDDEDDEYEENAEARVTQLRGTPSGTLAHNCCGEWVLLSNDGRAATRFLPITGTVCFPPDEACTNTEWCITTDPQGRATVHRLPDGHIWARFLVNGGAIANAVMPDQRTVVTLSAGGHLQWWILPVGAPSREPITLSAHLEVPAGGTFMALLEAAGDGESYLMIRSRHRRLTLLDPFTGAMRGEMPFSEQLLRARRTGPDLAALWDDEGAMTGLCLSRCQEEWVCEDDMAESQVVGLLPDGRMVRAAFGMLVEDPKTGETLADYRPD